MNGQRMIRWGLVTGVCGWVLAAACAGTTTPDAIKSADKAASLVPPKPPPPPKAAVITPKAPPSPWPPAALTLMPYIGEPQQGEGQWRPVTGLVEQNPGAPPLMFQTTLRNRKLRGAGRARFRKDQYYEIEVVVWEPEQVGMGLVGGLVEPKMPRGKRNTGQIPRRTEVMGPLIAAFNGGWRTKDARDSGIMVERGASTPLTTNRATVALYDDGRVRMGTWSGAVSAPKEVHSYRQNIEPIWAKDTFNPLGRDRKWGGTGGVAGADGAYTVRSGMCVTKGGHMAYIYGEHMDHVQLGEVMERVGCRYGMHLDMNGIHAGFEFYKLEGLKTAANGDLRFGVKAERLTDRMYYKPFPRYLSKRPKDFFYLTRRTTMPVALGDGLNLEGLPQPGSARHLPAAAAGQLGDVQVISWDTTRMPPGDTREGGLQILLEPGAPPHRGPRRHLRFEGGQLKIAAGGDPTSLLTGTRLLTKAPDSGTLRVLGMVGTFAYYLQAPSGSRAALQAVVDRFPEAGWLLLGEGGRIEVRTLAADGQRWVSYDGLSKEGTVLTKQDALPQGALVFALPAEAPLAGLLEDDP